MNRISLQQGARFSTSKIEDSFPAALVRGVKYTVGIALKEMGFDNPYETIPASSFQNSHSKVRVAIPTITDAITFLYSKLQMCIKINEVSYGTQSVYKYSIGTIILGYEEKMEFFPILEHKDHSYIIEDEINDALLRMYELFKKWKKKKSE